MKYHRLQSSEREIISLCLEQNESLLEIAQRLQRSVSTISREFARHARDGTPYRAFPAQAQAETKAGRRRGTCKIDACQPLKEVLVAKLRLYWSPKQIATYLKTTYPDDKRMHVSHETIYTYLYVQAKGTLKKQLIALLRQARKKRRPKGASKDGRGQIPHMISIDDRPPEVNSRRIPGHWEGDLVMGKRNQSAIGTLVERSTRFLIIVPLTATDAETVRKAFGRAIRRLPEHLRLSLTYDRGKEMAQHELFTKETKMRVYFAHPYSPWQRGTNENTNLLIRDFFPKGTDFQQVKRKELQFVQHALNERIRETLGWNTPKHMFTQLLNTFPTTVALET